jgi:hypothetical protein
MNWDLAKNLNSVEEVNEMLWQLLENGEPYVFLRWLNWDIMIFYN